MRARGLSPLLILLCSAVWVGCGDDACTDDDQDGFGPGCALGADCDDNDPTRGSDCSGPPVDCSATPFAAGCPCLSGTQQECFNGEANQIGIGECRAGYQLCGTRGRWSQCIESVSPSIEACNGRDDDCDGVIDDGVLSPCGGCDSTCTGGVWGEAEAPFEGRAPLALTPRGELTLAYVESDSDTLWVTNTGDDTVSRIDTARAIEEARYDSGGDEPTRVALDALGDAWIVNRAFDGQSTITKIASSSERCVDRGGDGVDTSSGPGDVKPRGQDDCVVLSVPVGGIDGVARAIAIDGFMTLDDAPGRVWVGMQNEQRMIVIDANTGAEVLRIDTPDFSPFDAAFDRWGSLWLIDRDGRLGRLNVTPDATVFDVFEVPLQCWQVDALAIDPDGRITLSGFYCDRVSLFDPRTERWQSIDELRSTRGVAADATHSVVVQTEGLLSVLTRDPLRVEQTFSLADDDVMPIETVGAAIDGDGDVWAISTLGAMADHGVATRFDLDDERVTAQVPVGRLPYASGDLTGRSRAQLVATEGVERHVFTGCTSGFATGWGALHVPWLPGVGSRLGVRLRHAVDVDGLAQSEPIDLGDLTEAGGPIPLSLPAGGVVEVELTLHAGSRLGAPRVTRVGLQWDCGGLE